MGGTSSVMEGATKTTTHLRSHDLYPGPSGAEEKRFPLILFRSASGKSHLFLFRVHASPEYLQTLFLTYLTLPF